jgi:toxin-antitoxin system PIN domain toxin
MPGSKRRSRPASRTEESSPPSMEAGSRYIRRKQGISRTRTGQIPVNSIDTNLLLYAANEDCDEHGAATTLVRQALNRPADWIVADQVYFELYRLLRNPAVLERPLSASQAWESVDFYRHQSGWMHCCYETSFMSEIIQLLKSEQLPPRRTFDLVLAITLKKHGVKRFYTRNVQDFASLDWFETIDPL